MKVELLLNDCNKQVSPMSEGFVATQANFKPCKVNHQTTWHSRVMKTPRAATVHNVIKESGRVLPRPSAVFHMNPSVDNPWVAQTLSLLNIHKRGKVSSNSATHDATKFVGPHKSYMRQYIMELAHRGKMIGP
jgi:hypothetical protein